MYDKFSVTCRYSLETPGQMCHHARACKNRIGHLSGETVKKGVMSMARVLLVGENRQLFAELKALSPRLEELQKVERTLSIENARALCMEQPVDVLLLELPPADDDQWHLLRDLLQRPKSPRLIALAAKQDEESVFRALTLGASAIIIHDIPVEFVASTIRQVLEGERPIEYTVISNSSLTSRLVKRMRETWPSNFDSVSPCPLSKRELEIMRFVARGYSNKEISYELNIHEQTVKNHVSSILGKIKAHDRAHAAVLALGNGWISLS